MHLSITFHSRETIFINAHHLVHNKYFIFFLILASNLQINAKLLHQCMDMNEVEIVCLRALSSTGNMTLYKMRALYKML